jgi:hypothetical protein
MLVAMLNPRSLSVQEQTGAIVDYDYEQDYDYDLLAAMPRWDLVLYHAVMSRRHVAPACRAGMSRRSVAKAEA